MTLAHWLLQQLIAFVALCVIAAFLWLVFDATNRRD